MFPLKESAFGIIGSRPSLREILERVPLKYKKVLLKLFCNNIFDSKEDIEEGVLTA